MSSPTSLPIATDGPELPEPPFPPQLVEELLRQLARAVKTHQLYLPNNPIYQRAIENLRTAFTPVWEQTSALVLQISEADFRWFGRSVFHDPSRSESLPWVFYKDGLRELTFLQGCEREEILLLLDILQRVRKASPDEDDLLTLLWEQEFAFLRYRFIDLGLEVAAPIQASPESAEPRQLPIVELRREAEEETARPGIVRMEDLDATLYFLDDHEIEYLRGEVQREQSADLRRNVVSILLDILEAQSSPAVREEVCGIFEQFVPHLLALQDYGAVAYLLRELKVVLERAADLPAAVRDRLGQLPARLSDPAVLSQLLRSLDDSATIPPQEDLDALFEQLRPGTLATVLGWLKQAQSRELRTALERAAARLASMNTAELLRLMMAEDATVAVEAIRRAAELKTPAAVGPLAKLVTTGAVALRQAAAHALAEIGSPGALRALENALDDEDRDVRITAVRAFGLRGHRGALPKIEAMVTGRAVRDADLTEKMAYFETYGLLAGNAGIEPLDALLNGRSLVLRRRLDPEIRACAALALGKIGTEQAMEVLRRAAGDKDVRVRSEINRALRGGTA